MRGCQAPAARDVSHRVALSPGREITRQELFPNSRSAAADGGDVPRVLRSAPMDPPRLRRLPRHRGSSSGKENAARMSAPLFRPQKGSTGNQDGTLRSGEVGLGGCCSCPEAQPPPWAPTRRPGRDAPPPAAPSPAVPRRRPPGLPESPARPQAGAALRARGPASSANERSLEGRLSGPPPKP